MTKIKSTKVALRFGTRYGKRNRDKFASIEMMHRSTHKCPYCNYESVRRKAVGIWECKKCGAKFTGRAYSPGKTKIKADSKGQSELKATEEPVEEPEEEDYEEEFKEESQEEAQEETEEQPEEESDDEDNEDEENKE